jgi:ketosteroid isomerase-like protein
MAKMPGVLRPRRKIDEVELELARSRTAARLADIFGGGAATSSEDLSHTEAPAEAVEVDQPPEAEQPLDADAAVRAERRGGSRPAIVIALPADLVGVMAEPDKPSVDDQPEPDRADIVGVMAGRGPASAVGPGDEWRSRASAYVLAQAFGIAPVAVPVCAADAPVREETGEARATQLTLDAVRVDVRRAGPMDVEPAAARDVVSDAESSNRANANRRTPEPRPPKEGQLRGTRPRPGSAHRVATAKAAPALSAVEASCPYCALLLQPPPESSRGCPRCRHRIIVKRVDGRAVYLTEAAVLFFDAERRRIASSRRWTRERQRWLKLAAAAGAPGQRAARLAAAQPSEDVVEAARTLYMTTVERSFRSAKRDRRWEDASHIRREQAMALFRLAGSPLTPPEALVKLQRDGVVAELRGIAEIARDAELVSAACCDVCLADDGRICRITQEFRVPRLPHQGCPKGLCRCRWDLAARDRTTVRRYRRRRPRANQRAGPTEPVSTV